MLSKYLKCYNFARQTQILLQFHNVPKYNLIQIRLSSTFYDKKLRNPISFTCFKGGKQQTANQLFHWPRRVSAVEANLWP